MNAFSTAHPPGRSGRPSASGFVLLEIVIALTVFAVVVTGLAGLLHASLDSANDLRRQASIRRGLEAILNEARIRPRREEMILSRRDESLEVEYRSTLEEVKWINQDGQAVRGLYRLGAVASDLRPAGTETESREERAELYVYRP